MCGGCRGEGAFSSRCSTQPGGLWRRLADQAADLGDNIASNDPEAANMAYMLAGRFAKKWAEIVAAAS